MLKCQGAWNTRRGRARGRGIGVCFFGKVCHACLSLRFFIHSTHKLSWRTHTNFKWARCDIFSKSAERVDWRVALPHVDSGHCQEDQGGGNFRRGRGKKWSEVKPLTIRRTWAKTRPGQLRKVIQSAMGHWGMLYHCISFCWSPCPSPFDPCWSCCAYLHLWVFCDLTFAKCWSKL